MLSVTLLIKLLLEDKLSHMHSVVICVLKRHISQISKGNVKVANIKHFSFSNISHISIVDRFRAF